MKRQYVYTLFFLGSVLLSYVFVPSFQDFINTAFSVLTSGNQERMATWAEGFGFWGPVVLMLLMVIQVVIAPIPSGLLMVVPILMYGPFWGGLIAFSGMIISATIGYWIGRFFGPVVIENLVGRKSREKAHSFIENYGFWTIAAARISPIISTDAVSLVAGLLEMRYKRFILATMAGVFPGVVVLGLAGGSIERLETLFFWVSGITILLLTGYIAYNKGWHRNLPRFR